MERTNDDGPYRNSEGFYHRDVCRISRKVRQAEASQCSKEAWRTTSYTVSIFLFCAQKFCKIVFHDIPLAQLVDKLFAALMEYAYTSIVNVFEMVAAISSMGV